ncbi:MAG: polysaccharide ABC transporter ATP-binding protein, partial [Actinomycetota bacterium]
MDAIVANGVSKVFRLHTAQADSLKDRVIHLGRSKRRDFTALHELDLTIPQGQTLGILGHNGSGKSTLLKCISGILRPTTGQVQLRGRIASLLELGAGFHPDLTGRENVYINAAFLGISRKEIERRFDSIVDFAELDTFIDEPVKHYSSGMYVRLGFAVAINLDPDILLVDEVLAVGDEVFQLKCINRIKQLQAAGRTIVFVTHNADTVREICHRAIVLDHGRVIADGEPGESIRVFREHLHAHSHESASTVHSAADGASITSVNVQHAGQSHGHSYMTSGDALTIEIAYESAEPIDDAQLEIELLDRLGRTVFRTDTDRLGT